MTTLDALRAQATIRERNFRAFTHMAVELEVAELLYALVRQSKPSLVVECGAGEGYSSAFIAQALRDNGFGMLVAFEQDGKYAEIAERRLRGLPGTNVVGWPNGDDAILPSPSRSHRPIAVVRGFSHSFWLDHADSPDLVFIDTLGEHREKDMAYWFAHPGRPLIVIHDAAHYPAETFAAGEGVLLGAGRGVWIGRGKA